MRCHHCWFLCCGACAINMFSTCEKIQLGNITKVVPKPLSCLWLCTWMSVQYSFVLSETINFFELKFWIEWSNLAHIMMLDVDFIHTQYQPRGCTSLVPHLIGPPSHWFPISLVPHLIAPPPPISLIPQLAPMHHSFHWPPSYWSPSHWSPNS